MNRPDLSNPSLPYSDQSAFLVTVGPTSQSLGGDGKENEYVQCVNDPGLAGRVADVISRTNPSWSPTIRRAWVSGRPLR